MLGSLATTRSPARDLVLVLLSMQAGLRAKEEAKRTLVARLVRGRGFRLPRRTAQSTHTPTAAERVGGLGSAHAARDHAHNPCVLVPRSPWAILSRLHVSPQSSSGEGGFALHLCDAQVHQGRV